MRIEMATTDAASVLTQIRDASDSRSGIVVARNVLISARDGAVEMAATNFDMSARSSAPADTAQAGDACVPLAPLLDFVKLKRASGRVEMALDGDGLRVATSGISIVLDASAVSDFPRTDPSAGSAVDLPCDDLRLALSWCGLAAGRDETRYYLNGVHVSPAGGLELVGLNGRVIHVATIAAPCPDAAGTVPNDAVRLITQKSTTGGAALSINDRQWTFSSGGFCAWGATVDGAYPDYRRLLPTDDETSLVFDRDDMLDSLSAAECGAAQDKDARAKRVILSARDGKCLISGAKVGAGVKGSARVSLDVDTRRPVLASFMGNYLRDAIRMMPEGAICMRADTNAGPATVISVAPEQRGVTMDMRATVMGYRMTPAEIEASK